MGVMVFDGLESERNKKAHLAGKNQVGFVNFDCLVVALSLTTNAPRAHF